MTDLLDRGGLSEPVIAGATLLVDALADAATPAAAEAHGASPPDPSRDVLMHRAALILARSSAIRNLLVFGVESATWDLTAIAAERQGALACSLVGHDPDLLIDQLLAVPRPFSSSRWVSMSSVPLALRRHDDVTAPMYRRKEIVLAREEPADLIVVNGPPAGLGGRSGMVLQALTFSRPGSIILFPALAPDEHAAITGLLRRNPDLAGVVDCSGDGVLRLAAVCLNPLRPGALRLPVANHPLA